jgi:hypothetical protein
MKKCSKCLKFKKKSEFYSNKKRRGGGLHHYCKVCARKQVKEHYKNNKEKMTKIASKYYFKNKAKISKRVAKWKKNNPDKVKQHQRRARLKKSYGITEKEYDAMLMGQGKKCLICEEYIGYCGELVVDHNHSDGKVRGLLCHHCNRGLGCFKDSILNLKRAIMYLERN